MPNGSVRPKGTAIHRRRTRALFALITLVLAQACTPDPEPARPNLFVVVVDTLRADRLDGRGDAPSLTPHLDAFARSATVFHHAYSTSAWTSPAVASLFTSRYPSQHGVIEFDSVLSGPERTLAEILTERGYVAAGFSSNLLVSRGRGFHQGFQTFQARGSQAVGGVDRTERAVDAGRRALGWIDERAPDDRTPIFVYLHVMDPHAPYAPDPDAIDRVYGADPRPDPDRVNRVMRGHLTHEIPEAVRRDVRGLYDAEVSSTDAGLEAFFSGLSERGLLDDAVVVVTADHGEELWDHGQFGHHHSLYREVLGVPLLIRAPGQETGHEVGAVVSLLDVAPTLLDLLGVPPAQGFEGRSLAPLVRAGDAAATGGRDEGLAVAELLLAPGFRRTPHERTVIRGDQQLIRNFDGVEHFVDLASGSSSEGARGISDAEKQALRDALDRFIARYTDPSSPSRGARERARLDPHERDELRALGYIE